MSRAGDERGGGETGQEGTEGGLECCGAVVSFYFLGSSSPGRFLSRWMCDQCLGWDDWQEERQ